MSVRERKEVQEVLRRLKPVVPATASHTHARRFRTDPSTPRKLNLRRLSRGDGINRGGLHQGWTIVGEYIDHESGKTAGRTQFQRMFGDAAQHRFDVVLFWSLDRLTREGALETLRHLDTLSGYRIGFRSLSEPYLDSCGIFKDAVIAILGTVAKQERVRLSERVRAGLDRVRANGNRRGNPIGRPKIIFDRDRVVELRRAGLSWREIARRTGVGITTVRRACQAATDGPAPCQNPNAEAV